MKPAATWLLARRHGGWLQRSCLPQGRGRATTINKGAEPQRFGEGVIFFPAPQGRGRVISRPAPGQGESRSHPLCVSRRLAHQSHSTELRHAQAAVPARNLIP